MVSPPRWGRLGGLALFVAMLAAAVVHFATAGNHSDGAPPVSRRLTGSVEQRITQLQSRVDGNPDDLSSLQQLGQLSLSQAIHTGDPAWYDTAKTAVAKAKRLAPTDVPTTVLEGTLQLSLHDFAAAMATGERASHLAPASPDALAVLVDASVELGHYDQAAAYLQQLLDLRPGAPALARVSYLRELHGDLPGARAAMQQAKVAAGGDAGELATIDVFVGDLALSDGDLSAAASAYDASAATGVKLVTATLGQARVQAANGHLDEAIARLSDEVQRSPQPAVATLLGELQQAAGHGGDADRSFELVRASIKLLAAAGATVDLEAALFEADHGDPAAAVQAARAAYGARNTVFTADALGWALTRAGRSQEALPFVAESLRLGTATASLHVHAAVAYAATGRSDDARTELAAAFARSPWTTPSLRTTATALADQLSVTVPLAWRP